MSCFKKNNSVALENLKSSESWQKTKKCLSLMSSNANILFLVLSMVLGICAGIGLRSVWSPSEKRKLNYFNFPGELLLNMLKMLILPLIVSSLISSLASLDMKASSNIGLRAILYYFTTTFLAVVLGIFLVMSIKPGTYGTMEIKSKKRDEIHPADSLLDLLRNCFPDNLISACFSKKVTKQIVKKPEPGTNATEKHTFIVTTSPGTNMLGIVVVSIVFGVIIGHIRERGYAVVNFFTSLYEASMLLVKLVIWYSPIGIFFLIATQIIKMQEPEVIVKRLGLYCLTVIFGLLVHGFGVLPLIYFLIVRKNPFVFTYNMLKALITALATSSSSATLPVTIDCLEFRNKVDPRIIKFVVPVGATVNMDGTALYEAVAAIFIAQTNGMSMSIGKVITVSFTATAAAVGAAGIPQAGLVTMLIVLTAVGLPTTEIGLILAVDWFLDRCRTTINVLGDAFGAGVVAKLSVKELESLGDNPEHIEQIETLPPSKEIETLPPSKEIDKLPPSNEIMITDSDEEEATKL